jgi:fructose-1,6-bisphosphatase/inositol monophosphatase family enzyme
MSQALSQTSGKVIDVPKSTAVYEPAFQVRVYGSKELQRYLEDRLRDPATSEATKLVLARASASRPGTLTSVDIWRASDKLSREAAQLLNFMPIE